MPKFATATLPYSMSVLSSENWGKIAEECLLYAGAAVLSVLSNIFAGTSIGPITTVLIGLGLSFFSKKLKEMGAQPPAPPSIPSANGTK